MLKMSTELHWDAPAEDRTSDSVIWKAQNLYAGVSDVFKCLLWCIVMSWMPLCRCKFPLQEVTRHA